MTDNNSKLRAVLLAALMVLWVFAGTMAFAGGAAAATNAAYTATPDTAGQAANLQASVDVSPDMSDKNVDSIDLDFSGASGFDNGFADTVDSANVDYYVNGNSVAEIGSTTESNGGETLTVTFSATQNYNSGDNVTIVVRNTEWTNPSSAGDYQGEFEFDPDSSSSAQVDTGTLSISQSGDSAVSSGVADATYDSGTTRWQGQDLFLDQGDLAGTHSEWQVREWDGQAADERVGTLVSEITFDDNDQAIIDTDDLEGDYVITANDANGENREVIITGSDGIATDSVPGADDAATGEFVEVVVQDLDAQFEDADGDEIDDVGLGESTNLSVDSNRNGFDVEVSSENLTQTELQNVFVDEDYTVSPTADDDDNVTISDLQSDQRIEVNFTEDNDIEAGDSFDFNFEVTDTTANSSASINIEDDVDGDVDFEQAQYTEQRGDIVTVNMTVTELDRFNVTFGGDSVNYEAEVTVEPNDDDVVTLDINTYLLSRTDIENDGQQVITAEEGDIISTNRSVGTTRDRVLDADLYDVIAEDDSRESADVSEYDVAVINLEERSTGNSTVHTAPNEEFSDVSDLEDVEELINEGKVTESDTIAIKDPDRDEGRLRGDTVVHKVDVSGIEGILASTSSNNFTAFADASANGGAAFEYTWTQTNPGPNQDRIETGLTSANGNEALIDSGNAKIIPDADNDTYYIIVRPDFIVEEGGVNDVEDDQTPSDDTAETGDRFNANLNVTYEFQNQFLREANQLEDDDDDTAAPDQFELVDREAEFDTVNDTVRVAPTENAEITGETTIAPGTEITVRSRATGESPFLLTNTTEVNSDGTFTGVFDFSNVSSGQEFNASIQSQSFEDDAETDGLVTETDIAEVEISNQTSDGTTATVDRVYLPDGGFVTIHDGTLLDGATLDSVRGTSDYLESGEHEDVEVTLDTPYEADGTVIAMPHMDTNGNETYDFVTSEGSDDGPYTNAEGEIVLDSASLTVDTSTPTPTATATATPEPSTPTATATDEPTETESEDQPGFGAVIALIALLGAALLAARRNAF